MTATVRCTLGTKLHNLTFYLEFSTKTGQAPSFIIHRYKIYYLATPGHRTPYSSATLADQQVVLPVQKHQSRVMSPPWWWTATRLWKSNERKQNDSFYTISNILSPGFYRLSRLQSPLECSFLYFLYFLLNTCQYCMSDVPLLIATILNWGTEIMGGIRRRKVS